MQRRFKVSRIAAPASQDIYSDTFVRDTDDRADAHNQIRRRARGTPTTMYIFVATPLPAGTPRDNPRHRVLRRWWAQDEATVHLQRKRYFNESLPTETVQIPAGAVQSGLLARIAALRAAESEAWTLGRVRSVHGNLNDIIAAYPWSQWGSPPEHVLDEIQRHMLEPVIDHGESWFDGLWTSEEVREFLTDRVNDFLTQTGCTRERLDISVPAGQIDITYPDVNEVRAAIWVAQSGATTPLELGDFHGADSGSPGWEDSSGIPERFITWGRGIAKLSPAPTAAGTLRLRYVPTWSGAANPSDFPDAASYARYLYSTDRLIPIPAIFLPFIKYGVMADMLSKEGEAHDEQRAKYCESRYEMGIEVARMFIGRKD
jgi:hypothetical protein